MATSPSLGTNLDGAAYYTTGFPYIDLMHQASEFIPQGKYTWDTGVKLDLDSSGWVTSLPAGTWAGVYPILHDRVGAETAGDRYIVMYDGDGTFQGALGATISEASPGRFVLTSASDGTVGFQITSTNPADYVRDIHVVREDQLAYFDAGIDFDPQFLEKVEDFHTFRFKDWMSTDVVYDANGVVPWPDSSNAANIEWADRPLMTDAQWNKGVPVEAMVELCNLAGVDGWFNMPVNASDNYVRQFATYVRDHLNSGLEVHVEFSNEVWNWAFPQSHYADAHDAGFANWMEWYGVRTAQVGRIWNEVFGESPTGGENVTGRVHVVYNTQEAWQGLESYGLETRNWYENGVHVRASDYFDEYAVTGYYNFNTTDHNVVRSWWSNPDGGFDAAVASLRQGVEGPLKAAYAYHAGQAAAHGLELTTYESGYGEVATNETADYQQFLINVQRQPELYDIEKANYQNFKDAGGGLYMNFGIIGEPSKWGSWSALESLYQETSPRYAALTDWNATVAPWYETGRDPSVFDSSWMLSQNSTPTIASNGGGNTAAVSIAENTTAVTTVTATDPDLGQTLSYSIIGGADAGKFTIGSATGALSFVTKPNFELPTDAGRDNVYDVTVQVSDGHRGIDTQAIAVSVQNVPGAIIHGTAGNDVIDMTHTVAGQPFPTAEEDILNGGAGSDTMAGGAGNDTYLVDNAADKVFEAVGGGTDNVYASANYALQVGQEVEALRANAGATGLILTGNEFNNLLVGLTGNDTLNGGDGNDTLNGGAGNDTLNGGNGNDTLDGQAGIDSLSGGAGNDTYLVDNAADKVFEAVGGGTDNVYASANYALQVGQEVEALRANAGATGLILTGNEFNNLLVGLTGNDTLNGGDGNDTLNGGAGNDTLNGGNGNDTLDGQAGIDSLSGGAGNDTYLVDNAADKVFEAVGGGTDNVYASANYALQVGQEVEALRANAGATGLILTGNEFNNLLVGLTGNDTLNGGLGNDTLNGGAGNDTLNGGNGNDTLDGQAGIDSLSGGAGNDTYLVDNAADKVFEAVGGGTDNVYASANYALQVGQEVEALRANAGATGLILTGNEFNNLLVGLTGNDTLNGGLGNDTLNGGAGNDTLNGGNGNDVLNGMFGIDIMAGGAGNDTFAWNAPTEGGDNITDFKILGTDVLQFNAAAFGFTAPHLLVNGSEFIANNSPVANHAGPTFLMETDVHNLFFDADGNGGGAAVLIAHINANAVASDFHLV